MDQNSVKIILEDIERNVNIAAIKYRNKSIWPVINYYLLFGLLKLKEGNAKQNKLDVIVKIGIVQKVANHFSQIKLLVSSYVKFQVAFSKFKASLKQYDVLCIDVDEKLYEDLVNEKYYSRYLSPYVDFIRTRCSTLLLNTNKNNANQNGKYILPGYLNIEEYITYQRIAFSYKKKVFGAKENVENFNLFKNYIGEKLYKNVVTEDFLKRELDDIYLYEKCWLKLLNVINPKSVFLSCHYGNKSNYGLLAASHQLGVKTTEIQHGISLDEMYLGYSKLNEQTQNYLPKFYWCWSKYDEANILKSRKNANIFMPVVGGNLWYSKSIHESLTNMADIQLQNFVEQKNPKKIVFVTLQHSIPLSTLLIDAISCSPKDWLWLVRFHPRDYVDKDYRSNYKAKLTKFDNVEFELTTCANIYNILKFVNIHVTHFSTTAVEAISFKVPTVLLDDVYKDIYSEYIKSDFFNIVYNHNQLIDLVNKIPIISRNNYEYFKMQYEESVALNAFNEISIS